MKKLAVIYHSGHGHTEVFARQVVAGAIAVTEVEVTLLRAEALTAVPEQLTAFDGFLWGSPTYLGGVSGPFKTFMDSTGGLWRKQQLTGKLAGGFTVSALPAGDKQSTLLSLLTFSMQHGMIWVGNPVLPEQHHGVPYDEAANRLGSWTGAMGQAAHGDPEAAFTSGDLRTARLFGEHFARVLQRIDV